MVKKMAGCLLVRSVRKSKGQESGKWDLKHGEEKPGRWLPYGEVQAARSQQCQNLKETI